MQTRFFSELRDALWTRVFKVLFINDFVSYDYLLLSFKRVVCALRLILIRLICLDSELVTRKEMIQVPKRICFGQRPCKVAIDFRAVTITFFVLAFILVRLCQQLLMIQSRYFGHNRFIVLLLLFFNSFLTLVLPRVNQQLFFL